MRALVFGVPPEPFEAPVDANVLTKHLARSPVSLCEVLIRFHCMTIGSSPGRD